MPFSDRTEWHFPAYDKHRLVGEITRNSDDLVDAVTHIQAHGHQFRSCVQAGGAVGVWPIGLATVFERVYTFEPDPVNYGCLNRNTEGVSRLRRFPLGLWHESSKGVVCNDEPDNAGAGYVVDAENSGDSWVCALITIDSMNLKDCDLIYLDIEGAETNALMGAVETIERCRPLIGIEDKKQPLWQRFGHERSPVDMLVDEFEYVELERYHLDVLLGPK